MRRADRAWMVPLVAVLLLGPSRAGAEWATVKPQHYQAGWASCYVETRVNTQAVLNEEDHTEQHWLQCREEIDEDHPTAISVHFTEHGDLRVTLYGRGITEETGEMIAVAIRIDDTPTMRREVPLDGNKISAIQEPAFAHMLLALLATGERAVIGVGSRSGLILLTAEVHAAVRDFQSRLPREE